MKTILILAILAILVLAIIYVIKKLKKQKTTTTTTLFPTTPTTTLAPPVYYTWYITEGTTNGCGNEVGSTPYYSGGDSPSPFMVTAFYNDMTLLSKYNPGAGKIGWNSISGPFTKAVASAEIDSNGDIFNVTTC